MKAILSGMIVCFTLFLLGCANTSTVPVYAYPSYYPRPVVVETSYDGYGNITSGYWQYRSSCCNTFPGSCCSGGCASAACEKYSCNKRCPTYSSGYSTCNSGCSGCNECARPVSLYDETD